MHHPTNLKCKLVYVLLLSATLLHFIYYIQPILLLSAAPLHFIYYIQPILLMSATPLHFIYWIQPILILSATLLLSITLLHLTSPLSLSLSYSSLLTVKAIVLLPSPTVLASIISHHQMAMLRPESHQLITRIQVAMLWT